MNKSKIYQILLPILTLLIGFILSPFESYLDKDFEDLATKKNISEITEKIESVKIQYLEKLELIKSELSKRSDIIQRKRVLYSDIAT